ncbi:MAG: nucleotidyltransferase domain-containing protein [Acidobacteriota bacterium]|nr:nucleotidyltransferase domain-containing protein [Acidobacteriota bacterium]MDH3784541.1 nucleotidyltransferase domain-containing protein [Acidobacteriota bacterium]
MQLANFLNDLSAWAESRSDVLGLAIVGSHARGSARLDSDVDLVVLCEKPAALANRKDWVARFGEVRQAVPEEYGVVRAVRVVYEDGLEVEFCLSSLEWANIPLDAGTKRVISDGMRILYDPGDLLRDAEIAAAA